MEVHAEKIALIAHFAAIHCEVINRYFGVYSYIT